jgi:hypothetical protein
MRALQVLKWFRFSEEFRNLMVFPLVALFFGTGNQTPNVAAAVIARVFLDPDLRLFDYCPDRLLNSVPVSVGLGLQLTGGVNLKLAGIQCQLA